MAVFGREGLQWEYAVPSFGQQHLLYVYYYVMEVDLDAKNESFCLSPRHDKSSFLQFFLPVY